MDGVTLKNYSEQSEDGKAKYQLYQFSGPTGDTVTIKMYPNTERMQMQGKPLWLFNEIVSLVSENGAEMSEVVDAHLKYCNVVMNQKDVFEEMEAVLGSDLFNYLSTSHKAILSTSFILSKIDMDMPDYSVSYLNPIQDLSEISGELCKNINNACEVLFDMLLTNGEEFNRFAIAKFDGKQIVYDSISVVNVSDSGELSTINSYYKQHKHTLNKGVLTASQKYKYVKK